MERKEVGRNGDIGRGGGMEKKKYVFFKGGIYTELQWVYTSIKIQNMVKKKKSC